MCLVFDDFLFFCFFCFIFISVCVTDMDCHRFAGREVDLDNAKEVSTTPSIPVEDSRGPATEEDAVLDVSVPSDLWGPGELEAGDCRPIVRPRTPPAVHCPSWHRVVRIRRLRPLPAMT